MPLTSHIGNAELSADPNTGLVLGDVNPAATQAGVMTRFRDADDENSADMLAHKADFDPHDHAGGSGGQPIGTGPVVAIAPNGIDTAALADGAVTSPKIQNLNVTTEKIADDTVEKDQLGAPVSASITVTGSGTVTFTFAGGLSVAPLFSIEAGHNGEGAHFTHKNAGSASVQVQYDFSGFAGIGGVGNPTITCRAYGCTGISAA